MELFSEIYSAYYRTVHHVLRAASNGPLTVSALQNILTESSFTESTYHILPKLQNGDWALLKRTAEGYLPKVFPPDELPLTHLQLSWIRAILDDPRIRLFLEDDEFNGLRETLAEISPLFQPEDVQLFDQARDGDNYADDSYRRHFNVFRDAIHSQSAVALRYEGSKGNRVAGTYWPYQFEYSSKDDKLRVHCRKKAGRHRAHYVLNLSRVAEALPLESQPEQVAETIRSTRAEYREVVLEITQERNALDRCMVQFAHFEKRTEYDEKTNRYTCTIKYNVMDETELVIRVLSFGPTLKVLGPQVFLDEIKRRVKKQTTFLYHAGEIV